MPQLDLLTFFTQFFWAVLCLFIFYFFVSKLILPELTRVLKYRSKASAFSTSGERLDLLSQRTEQGISDSLSDSSGRSGSSALYQYACTSSARMLMQARQRRDTFLSQVTSGKVTQTNLLSRKGESGKSFTSQASLDSHIEFSNTTPSENSSRATKASSAFGQQVKGDKKRKSSFKLDQHKQDSPDSEKSSLKNSKNVKNSKTSKNSRKI